jgi:hypothetical protein
MGDKKLPTIALVWIEVPVIERKQKEMMFGKKKTWTSITVV